MTKKIATYKSDDRPGEMKDLVVKMSELMRNIQQTRDECIKKALNTGCVCGAGVRTAKWVIVLDESPSMERLLCMCDAGHEWFFDFSTEFEDNADGGKVVMFKGVRR